jgi:hypothetical protein
MKEIPKEIQEKIDKYVTESFKTPIDVIRNAGLTNHLHEAIKYGYQLEPNNSPIIRKDIFGWFDYPGQEEPTHDPGLKTICPICVGQLNAPVKTISFLKDGDNRSYFYRTHKSCYESANTEDIIAIESSIIDE